MENTFRHRLNFTFLAFIQASVIVFARLYFGPEVYKRPQAAFHNLLVGVLVLLALACLVVPAPWSHLIALPYQVCALACVAYFVWIVASALLVGSRFAGLFAIAWTLPATAGLVRVLQNFEILPWGHWSERTTLTAMALEAIISAAAIIFQIRLIQAERDQARAGELKALELADRDPLTGVLNRRALLRTIVGREQLHQLVLIDVDHFKAVNEQLGHDGGDLVLSSVAAALTEAMPSGGLLARLGGDEFAAIIPVDGADGSRRVLERLSTAAAQAEAPVTFSMGVSTGTIRTEQEWRLLYKSADRALYKAKSEGRSLTRFADPAAVI